MRVSPEEAILLLQRGETVALPTETVYGLAACAGNPDAVEKIFALKGRPRGNPLIIHLANREQLSPLIQTTPPGFDLLADSFWPGPLTLVIPIIESAIAPAVRASLPSAAFRLPDHPLTRHIIEKAGPLVMPSANLSGKPTATCPAHVEADFGSSFPVVDGGPSLRGLESTLLLFRNGRWELGRYGAIAPSQFSPLLGYQPSYASEEAICPGRRYRHYSPAAQLILSKEPPAAPYSAILGFSGRSYPAEKPLILLGPQDDAAAVGANLYSALRSLDIEGHKSVWVDNNFPEENGLWITLRDRLNKAAH